MKRQTTGSDPNRTRPTRGGGLLARAAVLLALLTAPLWAETKVKIEGVPGMGKTELDLMLGDRLEHIRNKPASPARAEDAAFILRQLLRRDGAANAAVNWRIPGPDRIVLTATNAARLSLDKVEVLGCEEDDAKRLAGIFAAPARADARPGPGLPPFREADIPTGLSYLRQDYQARGHWTAEASEENRHIDPKSGRVRLTIRVKPGPLHTLGQPVVTSTGSGEQNRVRQATAPWVGQAATTANLNAMRKAVEDSFHAAGFPEARIAMANRTQTPLFIPEFNISQGKRVRLNQVTASGFEKTRPKGVEQRFKDLEGDWFDSTTLNERVREVLATGAFSSVRIETTPAGEDAVDTEIVFQEGRAREVTLAAGGDSYNGPIFRALFHDRNIWGRMLGFTGGFEFSSRGILGDARLTDPWLFGTDWAGTVRLYSQIYGHEGYRTSDTGLEVSAARRYGKHFRVEYLVGSSYVNTSDDGLPSDTLGFTYYQHNRFRATPTWERRDNPMSPTTGWYLKTPVQLGMAIGGDQAGYASLGINTAWYHPLGKTWRFALLGQGGMLYPTGGSNDFPIDLRFFNGGANTVRSFPERELGPAVKGYATGGNAYWAASAEFIRPVAGPLHLVGFLDAGAISLDYRDITSARLEAAVGLGLRVNLPIGPLRFEYGHSLTRDRGDPSGAFHFAIGASF